MLPLQLLEHRRINVRLFGKKKSSSQELKPSVVQCVSGDMNTHPFASLQSYMPFSSVEYDLYSALREAVPVIDGAIGKIIRLLGEFTVSCKDKSMEKDLNFFLDTVNVNGCSQGVMSFICTYADQLLTYGEAVGEIVPDSFGNDIYALYNGSLKDIALKRGDNPLSVLVCKNDAEKTPLEFQQLIMLSLLNPQPTELKGTSLLKGLPFVSSILLKIFNSTGTNFERVGNLRFAVTYKPDSNAPMANTREQAKQIASEWSKAMRSNGEICDFVSAGDVSIKVIGADNQVLDSQIPVRQMLEQIVSKLSIPPFLLGLNWSSTERMSSQQTDILTSELEYYRAQLNPVISKICRVWMRLKGVYEPFEINWNNINLQDEVELAHARLYNAQAKALEIENSIKEGN